jgi:hypothetical protein
MIDTPKQEPSPNDIFILGISSKNKEMKAAMLSHKNFISGLVC